MMATVPHVISGLGLRKFQADGFLLTRVYNLVIYLNNAYITNMNRFLYKPYYNCKEYFILSLKMAAAIISCSEYFVVLST